MELGTGMHAVYRHTYKLPLIGGIYLCTFIMNCKLLHLVPTKNFQHIQLKLVCMMPHGSPVI